MPPPSELSYLANMPIFSDMTSRFAACTVLALLTSAVHAQSNSPVESKTWYTDAAFRLSEIKNETDPANARLKVGDPALISYVYDQLQDEMTAGIVEDLAKLPIDLPASLPPDSLQRGIYNFVQLGQMQVAYMPMFAKMSAQAADDLFKKAKSPISEAAWNETSLARLWIRLGEVDKALAVLDSTSSLYIEHRVDLIRAAYAAAKVNEARALADTTLDVIRKTNPDITDTFARNLSRLIVALVQCEEIEKARAVLKEMPPSVEALRAHEAICEWSLHREEPDVATADLNALIQMLEQMDEFDFDQSDACVKAAKIFTTLRRDAEAIRCLDRLDQLAAQPDPPLTLPIVWADAARIALYTTAGDRADGYIDRCAKSIAADKDATDEDRLIADVAMARVYAVGGNAEEFEKRMQSINPRLKATNSFFASSLVREMFVELAGVTRNDQLLAVISHIANRKEPGNGEIANAYAMRLARTGEIEQAWDLARSIVDRPWRLRAMIDVANHRLSIHDEGEQLAALLDVRAHEDPREAAYVMLGVGARLNGDEGYVGDAMLRRRWPD